MNSFQTDIDIPILIIGYTQVGKTEILEKVANKVSDKKYNLIFPNHNLILSEINQIQDASISAEDIYEYHKPSFQQNAVIIIVYSKLDMNSYNFAKDLYYLICNSFSTVFFIETYQDQDDQLSRDQQFEQDIEGKVFKCTPIENTKEDLFSIFLYISTMFHRSIYSPNINTCFPTHDVRNLVATSEKMNRTFILTYKSIKMYSFNSKSPTDQFINFQFTPDFTFYHPISLISNYDGTKLILITKFNFYLIDKFHSGFDPTSFLPEVHPITPIELHLNQMPDKQIIDIQFLPLLPDYFAIFFHDKIHICRITDDDNCFDIFIEKKFLMKNEYIKMFRFRPIFDGMSISDLFGLYYLTSKGNICYLPPVFDPPQDNIKSKIDLDTIMVKINDRYPIISFKSKDTEGELSTFRLISYSRNPEKLKINYRKPLNTDSSKSYTLGSIIPHVFDFIKNEIVIFGINPSKKTLNDSMQLEQCKQKFYHAILNDSKALLSDVDGSPDIIDDFEGIFKIRNNLFVKTNESLYVFSYFKIPNDDEESKDELFVHEVIKSHGIVGFTNSPFSCIIAPGYLVDLNQEKHKFTRVNPILTYTHAQIKGLEDEYELFEKDKDGFFDQFISRSKNLEEKTISNNKKATEFHNKQKEIHDDAINLGQKLEELEKQAKEIFNKIYEIQHIQANKITDDYF